MREPYDLTATLSIVQRGHYQINRLGDDIMDMEKLENKLLKIEANCENVDIGAMQLALDAMVAECRLAKTEELRDKKWTALRMAYGSVEGLPTLTGTASLLPADKQSDLDLHMSEVIRPAARTYFKTVGLMTTQRGQGRPYINADEYADQQVSLFERHLIARFVANEWNGTIKGLKSQKFPEVEPSTNESAEGAV